MTERRPCQGVKKTGEPCRASATTDGYCPWHSPNVPNDVKSSWAQAGGLAHRQDTLPDLEAIILRSPKDAKRLLARMVKHVLAGTLSTARANSAGFLLRVVAELDHARKGIVVDAESASAVHMTQLNPDGTERTIQIGSSAPAGTKRKRLKEGNGA